MDYGKISFKDMNTGDCIKKGHEATFLNNFFVNICDKSIS